MRPVCSYTFFLFLSGFLLICVPGCLDIEEEIFFNKDGSGTYVHSLDMSGLTDMLVMMLPDSVLDNMEGDPHEIMDSVFQSQEMLGSLAGMSEQLGLQDGISSVSSDIDRGVLTVRFDFATVEQLNQALVYVAEQSQLGQLTPMFEWKRRRLIRSVPEELPQQQSELAAQTEMLQTMMGDGTYTTRYHFPGKVKSSTHPETSIGGGSNTVEIAFDLGDMLEDPSIANQDIRFRRK